MTPAATLTDGFVAVDDGLIAMVGRGAPSERWGVVIDAEDGWIVPGFIDLQVNGGEGIDLTTEPERAVELGRSLVAQGVTAYLPTMITAPAARRAAAMAAAGRWREEIDVDAPGAMPLGWHFEGPLISARRRGAHPVAHVVDDAAGVADEGWSPERGVVMVTLAPEVAGADVLSRELVGRGVVVALGHTDADAVTVAGAVADGATVVTHLFNAMRPFGHRDPGPIGVALGGDVLTAGLIVDGVHLDPLAVRLAWRALGPARSVLVTDAVAARGGPDARLGSTRLVDDGGSVRTPDGVLAGSVLTLDAALRRLIDTTGAEVPDAVATVTATPARLLGLTGRAALRAGARGDVTVLDRQLRVRTVVIGGTVAWMRPGT
ncbi:MAG: N-acetylglucosamine-6-phosphate deacetylase [Desertimonas sp.]